MGLGLVSMRCEWNKLKGQFILQNQLGVKKKFRQIGVLIMKCLEYFSRNFFSLMKLHQRKEGSLFSTHMSYGFLSRYNYKSCLSVQMSCQRRLPIQDSHVFQWLNIEPKVGKLLVIETNLPCFLEDKEGRMLWAFAQLE